LARRAGRRRLQRGGLGGGYGPSGERLRQRGVAAVASRASGGWIASICSMGSRYRASRPAVSDSCEELWRVGQAAAVRPQQRGRLGSDGSTSPASSSCFDLLLGLTAQGLLLTGSAGLQLLRLMTHGSDFSDMLRLSSLSSGLF
jgi:hypothetical protein